MMLKSTFWRVFISDNHDSLGVLGLERTISKHQISRNREETLGEGIENLKITLSSRALHATHTPLHPDQFRPVRC